MMMPATDQALTDSGYLTVDMSWQITACNSIAEAILGHPEQELLGRDCREIFCSDNRFSSICSHLKAIVGECCSMSFQHTITIPALSSRPFSLQMITLPAADGSILGAIFSFTDLSTPLAASRLALSSIAEGVVTVDHDRRITSFNTAAQRITGWSEDEVLGLPCHAVFHASICKEECVMAKAIQYHAHIAKRNILIITRDGRSVPVQISAAPLLDASQQVIGGVETFRDLTTILQQEVILDAVADGVFTVNAHGQITSFNRTAEKITGWKENEVIGRSCAEVLLASKSPQSCALTICMREKKTLVDRELFIIGKDGYSIPVSISAAPFLDPDGHVLGGVETFRENTARLQTALILDSIAEGVFTVDRNWRITSFNQAAELITGWTREKAIGQFCSDIFHSSICGKNCAIAESIYTGRPVTSQTITIQNRKNVCTHVSISAAPLLDHEGNVVGGVETFRDLSVEMSLRQQLLKHFTFDTIISKSPAMQRLFQILPDIAKSDSNVLILGESGTGKELIARAIYNASNRSGNPFVIVNCGALPETLLESELFGYKAGAFTDAKKDRPGRLAAAEGGTLFLDEIGDIPQSVQVKLLRVLQQKVYEPLGSNTPVQADVRILAATNRDLARLVQQGSFRDDLFYRLNVVNIQLPPLRDRREDIPLLIDHFVDSFRATKQKDIVGVNDEVMHLLMHHDYPGNIRELENIIEYGFILCPGGYIQLSHLPENLAGAEMIDAPTVSGLAGMALAEIERQAIIQSLERNGWKKMKTCRELGISKDTLRRKLRSYGFDQDGLNDPL